MKVHKLLFILYLLLLR